MKSIVRNLNGRSKGRLSIVMLTAFLAGCSNVPDAANPIEWYKGARNYVTGDKSTAENKAPEKKTVVARQPAPGVPGANEPFPKLSTVPDRPKVSSSEQRARVAAGLVADREGARKYSDSQVSRQDVTNKAAIPAPPATLSVASIPAPIKIASSDALANPLPSSRLVQAQPRSQFKPAPQMNVVTRKSPAMVKAASKAANSAPPALPNIVIPAENPTAPKLAQVTPYVPPAGLESLGTIIISGSGTQQVGGTRAAVQRSSKLAPRNARVSGTHSLSAFNRNNVGTSYQVATIMFTNGSSRLRSVDRRILRQVAKQHKQVGGTIRVVGHASSRTKSREIVRHKMVNFQISAKRAESVANALVKMGTKPSKLYVGAVSDSDPKYHEYMPSGEAGNRRTEIYIDY